MDFFSGAHKQLPTEEALSDNPEALDLLREWLVDDPDRPVGRPFNSMHRLGLEEPSDFDLNFSSGEMFRRAVENWDPERYSGPLTRDHGYLNKRLVLTEFPHLFRWAMEWTARTGREMSYAVFDESGPADVSHRGFFVHFQDTDWIVHRASGGETVHASFGSDDQSGREFGSAVDTTAVTEREWPENFSTEIVTDNGSVTSSEEAKTLVIQSVTDEMTAPTESLVAAGSAAHVDPSAVAHIGDGNYVIALRNSSYASMGGEFLHRSGLDPSRPSHTPDNLLPLDAPEAERILREMAVSELIMAWAHDSNGTNVRSLAIQEAAIVEFGLDTVLDWPMSDGIRDRVAREVAHHGAVHRELLRIQYELTQNELARLGVNNLVLYRGYSWPEQERPQWARQPEGTEMEMPLQRPLSSWTGSRRIAADWLSGNLNPGLILAARFPRERIMAFPRTGIGCLWQYEFVVLGGPGSAMLDGMYGEER
ncbi:hypothetical protein [Nocardia sp. R7R-8]|uniref:hypothetical protein n=1 Tax=Nocardia sp. R7R-8 TaxID=3459304 RepID=UPI00403DC609